MIVSNRVITAPIFKSVEEFTPASEKKQQILGQEQLASPSAIGYRPNTDQEQRPRQKIVQVKKGTAFITRTHHPDEPEEADHGRA
jgi:hypothetical protein